MTFGGTFLRILLVHPRLSIKGGGERVAIHSILAGLRRGHSISIVSEDFDVMDFEDFFGCGGLFSKVERISYPPFKPFLGERLLLYQRLVYHQRHIRRELSEHAGFDLVLGTQDIGYAPSVQAPVIQYCYFPEYFRHLQAKPTSPMWKLYYWPVSRFYRNRVNRVERFLSVSNYTKDFVSRTWGRDSEIVYPPCPIATYSSSETRKENIVITVGRLVPEKRIHLFVEIAKNLPSYQFFVIGSPSEGKSVYYKSLVRLAPANLSFILSPLRKERDLLAKAKVYAHCAENEHFGITIVEAMAAGCVPVVHDSGGPREIVNDRVGLRWRDPQEATRQVERVIKDDDLRRRLSTNAVLESAKYGPEPFESRLARIFGEYGF